MQNVKHFQHKESKLWNILYSESNNIMLVLALASKLIYLFYFNLFPKSNLSC